MDAPARRCRRASQLTLLFRRPMIIASAGWTNIAFQPRRHRPPRSPPYSVGIAARFCIVDSARHGQQFFRDKDAAAF